MFGFCLFDCSLEHDTFRDQTNYEDNVLTESKLLIKMQCTFIAEKLLEWSINPCSVVNNIAQGG